MMTVRMIEDFGGLKKGEKHTLDHERAKFLISKGYAMSIKETATNKEAENALLSAKTRDNLNQ